MAQQDFNVDSLAAYLHLLPAQVSRAAERGTLPGRKVAGEWKFSAADVHHWLEERLGLLEEEHLSHVETVLERSAPSGEVPISIAALLPVEAVAVPLAARTRRSVIESMAELAASTGHLWDAQGMAEAVLAREEMQPTALETGVALLHPRRPMANILAEPLLALGITPQGIPFGGARGRLTDIFFLICSIDDRQHLRTLARLSRVLADAALLDGLRQASSAGAARALLVEREAALGE
jgi:PTS system nitrogen regulatory IIA component